MVAGTVAAGMVAALAAPAQAAESFAVGQRYKDGLDSRYAAQQVADDLRAVGYTSTGDLDGAPADDVWAAGLNSGVIGYFGHANAGLFAVDEGPTVEQDQFMGAGLATDVVSIDARVRWWSEYLPFVEADGIRLAILAGCYTANESADFGSFLTTGSARGIDSVVGFSDFVYFPAACTSCGYSGNYYWDRFAVHAKAGHTVANALSLARSDLVAKEGNAGGWNLYRISGSVSAPGSVRVTPAGYGQGFTSQPFGLTPFTVAQLTPVATTSGDSGATTDVTTQEGVFYRVDTSTGRLRDLTAPASTTGETRLDLPAAATAGRDFVAAHVPGFTERWVLEGNSRVTHVDGEELASQRWRSVTAGGLPGPALADVEVDLRTGAVTYLSSASAAPATTAFDVDRDRALEIAAEAIDLGGAVTATADVWDTPRWTVTVDRGLDGLVPDVDRVVIDGVSGAVTQRTAA